MDIWLVREAGGSHYVYERHKREEDARESVQKSTRRVSLEVVQSTVPDVAEHGVALWEVQELFAAIETGNVLVTPIDVPDEVYAGNVSYRTSNGWQIVVFNDCASFDYVDSITTPDGREVDTYHQELVWNADGEYEYWPPDQTAEWLKNYGPPGDQEQSVWQIDLRRAP